MIFKICLLVSLLFSSNLHAFEVPTFKANVVDVTGQLTSDEIRELNLKILELRQRRVLAAILVVNSVQPLSIEAAANKTFQEWKLGSSGIDNGLLFLVSIQDRKTRIEVGYGLEGAIPDIRAKQIIEDLLIPNFKIKHYKAGLIQALEASAELITSGETKLLLNPSQVYTYTLNGNLKHTPKEKIHFFGAIWLLLIIVAPIFFRVLLVKKAFSYPHELRPTNAESNILRLIFVSRVNIVLILTGLFLPGVFFIAGFASGEYGIATIATVVLFPVIFIIPNQAYLSMLTQNLRSKFVERRTRALADANLTSSELPFYDGTSSSGASGSDSSSDGGSSGGGGASGSW